MMYILEYSLYPSNNDQDSHIIYQLGNDPSSTNQHWAQKWPFGGIVHSSKNQNLHSAHFL